MTYKTNYGVYFNEVSDYAKETKYLTYFDVVNREIKNLILFNEINSIDENFFENVYNFLYEKFADVEDEEEKENEIYNCEYFQYYITDCSEWDYEFINKKYPNTLDLIYSEKIGRYILCVDHFGTSWNYVSTDIKIVNE